MGGRRVRIKGQEFESISSAADAHEISAQSAHCRLRSRKWPDWQFMGPPQRCGAKRGRLFQAVQERLRKGPATAAELEEITDAEPGTMSPTLAYYRNQGVIDRDLVIREEPGKRPAAVGIWRLVE